MRVKDHYIAKAFFKGLRPVVAGLIVCAALSVCPHSKTPDTPKRRNTKVEMNGQSNTYLIFR
jgi:chromate transport protein ChrA